MADIEAVYYQVMVPEHQQTFIKPLQCVSMFLDMHVQPAVQIMP